MSIIEAVYRHGVFEPLKPVNLPEEQRVEVRLVWHESALKNWIREAEAMQGEFVKKHGYLPDSTPDIAEDRMR
jgi:predicted DNA-binding antitoxin AbrB/MazE fold protein